MRQGLLGMLLEQPARYSCINLTKIKEVQKGEGKIVFVPVESKKNTCLAQLVLRLRVVACVLKKLVCSHMLFVLL